MVRTGLRIRMQVVRIFKSSDTVDLKMPAWDSPVEHSPPRYFYSNMRLQGVSSLLLFLASL